MAEKREMADRLKDLGIEIYNAAKKEYDAVVASAEKTFNKEKLRKRFNLENPYRFVMLDTSFHCKLLERFFARNAKRYDEDDILVFFDTKSENGFQPKHRIKDLSDNTMYEIIEVVDVTIPVTLENQDIDVPCTAVYCKVI